MCIYTVVLHTCAQILYTRETAKELHMCVSKYAYVFKKIYVYARMKHRQSKTKVCLCWREHMYD